MHGRGILPYAPPFTPKCRHPNIHFRSSLSLHPRQTAEILFLAHGHLTLAAVQSGSSTYHHGTQDVNNHWFLGRFYQMEITTRFLRRLRRMRGENMYTFPRASRKASRGICAATAPRKIVISGAGNLKATTPPSPPTPSDAKSNTGPKGQATTHKASSPHTTNSSRRTPAPPVRIKQLPPQNARRK